MYQYNRPPARDADAPARIFMDLARRAALPNAAAAAWLQPAGSPVRRRFERKRKSVYVWARTACSRSTLYVRILVIGNVCGIFFCIIDSVVVNICTPQNYEFEVQWCMKFFKPEFYSLMMFFFKAWFWERSGSALNDCFIYWFSRNFQLCLNFYLRKIAWFFRIVWRFFLLEI